VPTIDDQQAKEIAKLAVDLETEMGWPVDLEFAYHANDLYLLQCRPITTL
jgi:pyruvate,water dikinase